MFRRLLQYMQETSSSSTLESRQAPLTEFAEVQARGDVPSPRSGHVAAADEQNHVYVYGGYYHDGRTQFDYPELYRYHVLSDTWQQLRFAGQAPRATCSQSMIYLDNSLITFGGTSIPFGAHNSNSLHCCDLKTLTWREIVPSNGIKPSPRFGQTLTYDAEHHCLWMFAGTVGHVFYNDLWKFDLNTNEWTEVDAGAHVPPGRYRHQALLIDGHLWIVGGGDPRTMDDHIDHAWLFDTTKLTWQKIDLLPSQDDGYMPVGVRSHACVYLNNAIHCIGGCYGDGNLITIVTDHVKLDLATRRWALVADERGQWPVPAFFHSCVVTGAGIMVTFGGVSQIDEDGHQERTDATSRVYLKERIPSLQLLCCHSIAQQRLETKDTVLEATGSEDIVEQIFPQAIIEPPGAA